jgi:hypothetical protein
MTGPFLTLATIAGAVVLAALTWSYLEGRRLQRFARSLVDAYYDEVWPEPMDPRLADLWRQELRR